MAAALSARSWVVASSTVSKGGAALGLGEELAATTGAPDPNNGFTKFEPARVAALLNSKPGPGGAPASPAIELFAGTSAAAVEPRVNDAAPSLEVGAGADPPKLKAAVASAGAVDTGSAVVGAVALLLAVAAGTDSAAAGAAVALALKLKAPEGA